MSGSTNGANLPVKFQIEGVEQVQRTLRETTQQFVDQARAAGSVGPAVTNAAEAFQRLEQRAAAARGVVNDLRGAMDLLGAGNLAGLLGPVGGQLGNVADAMSVLGGAARSGAGALGMLVPALGAVTVAVTAGVTIWQAYGNGIAASDRAITSLRGSLDDSGLALERFNALMETSANRAARMAQEAGNAAREARVALLNDLEVQRGAVMLNQRAALNDAASLRGDLMAEIGQVQSRAPELTANRAAMQATAEARARARGEPPPAPMVTDPTAVVLGARSADVQRLIDLEVNAGRATDRLRELDEAIMQLRSGTPSGAQIDALNNASRPTSAGGGGAATDSTAAFDRAEALARRTAQAAIDADKRARDQIAQQQREATERFERQSVDAFSRIGENAADRIGTGIVAAFVSGERAALDFGSLARSVFASVLADLAKLAVINPVANGLLGTTRPTLGGAVSGLGGGSGSGFGGLSDLFTVGSTLDKLTGGNVSGYFGGGGGGIISGIDAYAAMNLSSIFSATSSANVASASSLAALTPEALASAGSVESLMALLPASSGSAMGVSLSGMLGGIGAGYGIGSLIGTYVAGDSPARQLNAQIGAGGGAVAGAAIGSIFGPGGTLVGGIIGGAAGGGGGGLIGPGAPTIGGDVLISVDGSGRLAIGGYAGKGFDPSGLVASTRGQVDQVNAQLAAAGLRFNSDAAGGWLPDVGWVGGGASGNPVSLSALLASGGPGLRANDPRLQGVLDRFGATGNVEQSLALAAEVQQFTGVLDALKASAAEASDPLAQIRAQFDGLRATAERLGFGLDDVTAAQERAIKQYEDQKREQERAQKEAERNAAAGGLVGTVSGITAYARSLRTANDNSGNPLSRLAAAEAGFFGDIGLALNGNIDALGRATGAAETYRTASRAVFGTGQGYAATESRIAEALGRIGGMGAEALTQAGMAAINESLGARLESAVGRLQDEVTKLRTEVAQGQANPLVARAA
jgi:hypothetical protein